MGVDGVIVGEATGCPFFQVVEEERVVINEGDVVAGWSPGHEALLAGEVAVFVGGGVNLTSVAAVLIHEPEGVTAALAVQRVGGA